MRVIYVNYEDFTNYRKPSVLIGCKSCSGKCNVDLGRVVCQNNGWRESAAVFISDKKIIKNYFDNAITQAFVFGVLEPFDQFEEVFNFISRLRVENNCHDDVVIYSGYNKEEICDKSESLKMFDNIIVKFGRYIPGQEKHYDEVLGVYLASDNQYAERIC